MKKLISFSIWGKESLYLDGLVNNIGLARTFYPGWDIRVYHQENVSRSYLEQLAGMGVELVSKPLFRQAFFGAFWRFLPMMDENVERFIVRDADARISAREADAVREWIESDKPFHIMRDNPAHNVTILAGMWGAIPGCVPDFEEMMNAWMISAVPYTGNPRGPFHGTDQDFLDKHVWPVIMKNHIAHGIPYYHNELPFRVENPDGYKVGT